MTAEAYISMCEQMGEEIDYKRIPPTFSELPWYVKDGLELFNNLPDTYTSAATPIYIDKDISSLETLMNLYGIESESRLIVYKVIRYLDNRAKKKALQRAKQKSK